MKRTEFEHWLRRHHQHFRSYAPNEIAFLAVLCGFQLEEICSGVSDQVIHIKRLLNFWESPLNEQWMRLTAIERGTDD